MEISSSIENIEKVIDHYRKELIEMAHNYGLNSSETLLASQRLDDVLLIYQKLHF